MTWSPGLSVDRSMPNEVVGVYFVSWDEGTVIGGSESVGEMYSLAFRRDG
jgi:hypothetical protein